jgi:rod shape-determining protein MreC
LLKEIPLQCKFHPGDTIYTSGYSSIFPADIPLGVTGESRIVNGATNEIKIKLFQDFSTLRYVTVVTNVGAKEMEYLEKKEEPATTKK